MRFFKTGIVLCCRLLLELFSQPANVVIGTEAPCLVDNWALDFEEIRTNYESLSENQSSNLVRTTQILNWNTDGTLEEIDVPFSGPREISLLGIGAPRDILFSWPDSPQGRSLWTILQSRKRCVACWY
jgi:hypothetical protein